MSATRIDDVTIDLLSCLSTLHPPPPPNKVSCQPGLSFDVAGKGSNLYIVDFDEQLEEKTTRALVHCSGQRVRENLTRREGNSVITRNGRFFFIADARANYIDMDFCLRIIHQILKIKLLE